MRLGVVTLQIIVLLCIACQGSAKYAKRGHRWGARTKKPSFPLRRGNPRKRIDYSEPFTPNEEEGLPEVPVCMLNSLDRHPRHLAQVLEKPKKYIEGPLSQLKGPQKHYTVVGAGMSGLIAAYLLLSVGHKVTMFEADERVGGRVYTRYENGFYGDVGAMRYPMYHMVVQKALRIFDVKTTNFTNRFEGSEGNYYFLHGKYFLEKDLEKQDKLRELYELYEVKNIPKDENGRIQNPKALIGGMIKKSMAKAVDCSHDVILHDYLREKCEKKGIDPAVIIMWGDMSTTSSFLAYSVLNMIKSSDEKSIGARQGFHNLPYVEIVNGSAYLPYAIFYKLQQFKDFTVHMKSQVYKIDNTNNRMKVYYGADKSQETHHETEELIIGTTAKAVLMIDFTKPLPPWKYTALSQLKYINAFKVFLKFKTPFWSEKENNLAAPILYGEYSGKRAGSVGITNSRLVQVYYPSHEFHGPTLIGGFSMDNGADFWLSFTESESIDMVLEELSKIHGPVVREQYESGFVYNWITNPYSHGGFVWWEPYQRANYYEHLSESFGNIRFVGEYTNKWYHGWVESAVGSSIRLLVNENPRKYDERFAKAETAFLHRKNRVLKK